MTNCLPDSNIRKYKKKKRPPYKQKLLWRAFSLWFISD